MSIHDDWKKLKKVWVEASYPARCIAAISFFLSTASLASIGETVIQWIGFFNRAYVFYIAYINEPFANIASKLGIHYSRIDVDIIFLHITMIGSTIRASGIFAFLTVYFGPLLKLLLCLEKKSLLTEESSENWVVQWSIGIISIVAVFFIIFFPFIVLAALELSSTAFLFFCVLYLALFIYVSESMYSAWHSTPHYIKSSKITHIIGIHMHRDEFMIRFWGVPVFAALSVGLLAALNWAFRNAPLI